MLCGAKSVRRWAGNVVQHLAPTKPGTGESTPADMLKPVVVYESPNVKRKFVVPHASFADADPIDSADSKAETFQNSISDAFYRLTQHRKRR